ncbi:Pleckstrin homology domain-domain-containing protein [Naematelia encephala]|uniref:Pleckstrin homology domain-domain-containing protein n=1 Tax=Naematelia encephala TaxID=71784 RepID=A0A1Y2AP87_9TREE|nr:Pleckstrin homology domain-domain-containing protein [Naematelia encephala]
MPAVPHTPSTSAPLTRPSDPNRPDDQHAHTASNSISHQPAPAVIASASHINTHVLPRRFLGPMPEAVVNSDEVLKRRRHFQKLRRKSLGKLGSEEEHGRVGRAVRRIRVHRRDEEDSDSDSDTDDIDSDANGKRRKRKDVWVGESFDIGREFLPSQEHEENDHGEENAQQRPPNPPRSTQETFVTARTHIDPGPSSSDSFMPRAATASQTSSMQPLIPDQDGHDEVQEQHSISAKTTPLKTRLSALRGTHTAHKSKSVQFPVDPVQPQPQPQPPDSPLKGNKRPADPEDVLARQGDDAAGTSYQATEEALESESQMDEWEDPAIGQVLMRDRMLVRVAYHREENIRTFDEAFQRRKPCTRLDPMEEYIVVWRKGRIELYSDWRTPLRERWSGKQLCFVVPLSTTRTSLSIFNMTDMTLSLTTAASRLGEDMERLLNSTRYAAMKDRVKNSRQANWLKRGRKGSHIFVLKIAERSRAVDWYWELWRELGGELPPRIDIFVPTFSTSVRLLVPEDEEVGGRRTRQDMNPKSLIKTCWDLLDEAIDLRDLLKGREEPDLELAWKTMDGSLDWLAHRTTVQGKTRDWDVLAGVARGHELQLRPAQHQPRSLRLEDGTFLDEPAGIEGYLVRHTPRQEVYVATHDGNMFIAEKQRARPPLKPGKETPMDIFRDVFKAFQTSEHRRMASFIGRCTGCFDLRSISGIKLDAAVDQGGKRSRCFDVSMPSGDIRLEAHSPEIAKEWVERLEALIAYWKLRHRVDARQRMDAIALTTRADPFAGIGDQTDQILGNIWDWCAIKGCRSVTMAGRLYFKHGKFNKFRSRYIVLTGGCLVSFKVKSRDCFLPRKNNYPLFGAYVYSGMLAQDELHESVNEGGFQNTARVYQDGLQSSDGAEDTTFCVRLPIPTSTWGKRRTQPWEMEEEADFFPPGLSSTPPALLIFRARSKLERDRWVWGINAEMERQVRSHVKQEEALRQLGQVPDSA